MLFGNNYLFFISAFLSIGFFAYIVSLNWNNFFLLSLHGLSNVQNTIYHKYYEPMVIILFFTLLSQSGPENFLKKKYLIYFYYPKSLFLF